MPRIILLIAFLLASTVQQAQAVLQGSVTEEESGDPLIGATVIIFQQGKLVAGTEADFDGQFQIRGLPSGVYEIVAKYVGFEDYRAENFTIKEEKAALLDIAMFEGEPLEPMIVTCCYCIPGKPAGKVSESTPAPQPEHKAAVPPKQEASPSHITLFPNPASQTATLSTTGYLLGQVAVFDALGKLCFFRASVESSAFVLELDGFSPGLYWVHTEAGVSKLVVVR